MSVETSLPITDAEGTAAVQEFFQRMSRYCAARDFDAAEALFAPDVASFGTRATVVEGLDRLRKQQWQGIWTRIEDFRILSEEMRAGADGDLAWGMAPWTSTGFDTEGNAFD